MSEAPTATVLFDGRCRVCTAQAGRLRRFARGRIATVPYQEFESRDPRLSQAELDRELKLVTPAGEVFGGAEAIVRIARLARPLLGFFLSAYYTPGIRQLADRLYAWVARNRYRLFGRSEEDACTEGVCAPIRR